MLPAERAPEACDTVTICNQRGLHARAAAKFVKLVAKFDAEVEVERNDMVVSGQSIMGLMMLAASQGCNVTLRAKGNQADAGHRGARGPDRTQVR